MYEPHPIFETPNDDARLWRYMDLTKFIALLDTKTLYFARADLLGDAWEGAASRFNVKMRPIRYQEVPETVRRNIFDTISSVTQQTRIRTYISCWHMDQHESDAMWKLYMKANTGIAIQTTLGRLKESMTGDKDHKVCIGKVRYIDYDTEEIPENNAFWPFLHKRASFRHESEVRAILFGAFPLATQSTAAPAAGVEVPVSIDVLIERVYVAPMTPTWVAQVIKSVLERFGLQEELQQSSLSEAPIF
jgi:hypothetical protein